MWEDAVDTVDAVSAVPPTSKMSQEP
jgi:hypothetical protein